MLNKIETKVVEGLRRKGFAVVMFNPTELNGADADNVEDILVERGWNVISTFSNTDVDEIASVSK